ncbi:hypothetical protein AU252_00855 [Pseudarthrobacter sulfonivorans]|uniref:Uncharacterized protein n=1 Tax=Pseudarthrobacter sulfonivorans TaxID=121292 RepID=A0A0U3R3T7_9MICC|nr:hypothetical protein AU252_00855 [Pseudarthrobacter sulfonivorans]
MPLPGPVRIKDITAGDEAPQRRLPQTATDYTQAGAAGTGPAIMAGPRRAENVAIPHFISLIGSDQPEVGWQTAFRDRRA